MREFVYTIYVLIALSFALVVFEPVLPVEAEDLPHREVFKLKHPEGGCKWAVKVPAKDGLWTEYLICAKEGFYSYSTGYRQKYYFLKRGEVPGRWSLFGWIGRYRLGEEVTEGERIKIIVDGHSSVGDALTGYY